jgi:nicotinate-nucleotide pyrophosphorylase (carboxylating)
MIGAASRPSSGDTGRGTGHTFSDIDGGPELPQPSAVPSLDAADIRTAVVAALAEDLGSGDATTLACIPPEARSRARMNAREPLNLAGIEFAETAFRELSPGVTLRRFAQDGDRLGQGQPVLEVSGPSRALLSAERVALNYVQRLSGVATATAAYVAAVQGTRTRILDTRKTTPGWRKFEKYAVACGGGTNHRFGLHDLILIKDNHLAALAGESPDPITAAVRRARSLYPLLRVEVEADTPDQAESAAAAGADIILLDNMSPELLRESIRRIAGRSQTEASGGITLATVRAAAETGVDFISVGAVTHSARSVDLGLDFLP